MVDNRTEPPDAKFLVNKKGQPIPWEIPPDEYMGFEFIKLDISLPQTSKARNIWEKSWKTWYHTGKHHIDEAEWFLKIDDDTFFSPVNFKGFARYFNPNKPYYMGHTLMHLWKV